MTTIFESNNFKPVNIDEKACLKAIDEMTPQQFMMIGDLIYNDDYNFNWTKFINAGPK